MKELFFNSAAIASISKNTAEKMSEAVLSLAKGAPDIRGWVVAMEKCRRLVADLFQNDGAESVGFMQNTSQAISTVAEGLTWERGDEIIVPTVEYPANQYPWLNLERKGVVVVPAEPNPDGGLEWEDLEGYVSPKTKLIAFSYVQFRNGYRCDIGRIGAECQKRGILSLADVIQAAGVHEINQKKWGIDFLVAGSQKWLKGPPGIGILSVKTELLSKLIPVMTGAFSVKNPFDVGNIVLDFQDDGHRFESGTMNFLGFVGFEQALKEVTDETICRYQKCSDKVREELLKRGFTSSGSKNPEKQSSIVTVTHSTIDMEKLFEKISAEGVIATFRENSIRFAPDFAMSDADLRLFLEIVDRSI